MSYLAVSGGVDKILGFFGLGSNLNYTCEGKICRAKDPETKKAFIALQRAINMINGDRKVSVDGILGPETLSGFKRAALRTEGRITAAFASTEKIASVADKLARQLVQYAKEKGIKTSKGAPAGKITQELTTGGFDWKKMAIPLGAVAALIYFQRRK